MTRTVTLLGAALFAVGSSAQAQRLEVRLGTLAHVAERSTLVLGDVRVGTGLIGGADLLLRYRMLGLRLRVHGGQLNEGDGSLLGTAGQADVAVMLGVPLLSAEGGVARRGLAGAFGVTSFDVSHVGASSQIPIGSSGIAVRLAGGIFSPTGSGIEAAGLNVETNLLWFVPRRPIYLVFGYRHEQFRVTEGTEDRDEELGSILIGGGLRFTRRP